VSLKSRIREAQREAPGRIKRESHRDAGDKDVPARTRPDAIQDEMNEAMPTVDQIRDALLRKSSSGRNPL